MRKAIYSAILIGSLIAASCHKSPPSNPGGSWTFKKVTYPATSCIGSDSLATLAAADSSGMAAIATVTVNFYNVFPSGNGTYTVVGGSYPTAPYQVTINATIGDSAMLNYQSTGGNGTEMVVVAISNGQMTLTGSGIEMINSALASDSAALSLHLAQLQ